MTHAVCLKVSGFSASLISLLIDIVINIDCDESELIRRISGRRVCKVCGAPYHVDTMKPKVEGICDRCGGPLMQRKDDNPEALKIRLEHYNKETKPLLEFYEKRNLLKTHDGMVGTQKLFDELAKLIKGA